MMKATRQVAALMLLAAMISVTLVGCGVSTHKKSLGTTPGLTGGGAGGGSGIGPLTFTGTRTLLDVGETNLFGIAQDATTIYYTAKNAGTGLVLSIKKDGSQTTPTTLATGGNANNAWGIDVDGTNVYYTQFFPSPNGALWSVPKTGGTPTQLANGLASPTFVRLNNGTGGDGKLYVCENISNGFISRYSPTATGQAADSTTRFLQGGVVPPFNLHFLSSDGTVLLYSTMSAALTSSNHGEIRAVSTNVSRQQTESTDTLDIATGLLNPTDFAIDTNGKIFWTEYSTTSGGGVFEGSVAGLNQAGTQVGLNGPDSEVGCSSVTVGVLQGTTTEILLVTRNLIETTGGGLLAVDVAGNTATAVTPGANFPWQMVADGSNIFMTEFDFSNGASGSLNPSRLVKISL